MNFATKEELVVIFGVTSGIVLIAIIAVLASRGSKRILDRLEAFARAAGWQDVRRSGFQAQVAGMWNGSTARLRHQGRYKSVPERLTATVERPFPTRVIIKRKFKGFWTRPLTWFGPPIVETRAQDLWVRADEISFASRLVDDSRLASLIAQNLVEPFDEIRLDRTGIRVLRALDERNLRQRFGRSRWGGGYHEPTLVAVIPEQWELTSALTSVV